MSGFRFVLLPTDVLFGLLLVVALLAIWQVRGNVPLRDAWCKVWSRPLGMASATILAAFLIVAVMDSVHLRLELPSASGTLAGEHEPVYSAEVLSLLDVVLTPLRTDLEKTYSAPLAAYAYAKENLAQNGREVRTFPRLRYGGVGLTDPGNQRLPDLLARVGRGIVLGMVAGLALGWMLAWWVACACDERPRSVFGDMWAGRTRVAWRACLVTLLVMGGLIGIAGALASGYHLFGTDKVGQDVLFLALKSVRTAVLIGTLTTIVLLPLAVGLGVAAGYLGGWVDDVVQYLYTVLNSIPGVLLIAAAVLLMQVVIEGHPDWFGTAAQRADARLLALCAILGLTSWTSLCRLLRGETLKLRELDYVQAARAFGVSVPRIMLRHILPNLAHIILITLAMDFSSLVLAEAVLSYIGIGVDPATISFGTMINSARLELAREPVVWWSLSAAFAFMFVLVLSANLFADAVREAFDPRAG